MLDAYIFAGLRTPFGRHGGALASVRPDDLAAHVIHELLARHAIPGEAIEDVILGNTNQAGEDSRNIARHAALLAGLPVTVPGQTVNRLCASGLAAVIDAARAVTCNEGELFVAGGVESMSRAPFVMAKAEAAYSRELTVFDSTIGARFPNPKIVAEFGNDSMPQTGDNVAQEYGISRAEADVFAAGSQARYEAARSAGFFQEELLAVSVPTGRKTPPNVVEQD
ncbi:MAG TPA: 3-oxoadipyl-CoA thiolase, partial [Pseudomonas sp.]|nr:3-oxoadipyl-CoA thiolase [Pseudomonas sp.]